MTAHDLIRDAEHLQTRIAGAAPDTRLRLQPEFTRLLDRLRQQGEQVPSHLRQLDARLMDEAIEAGFDNLPV